jgi:orotate phosphoribosyltransferase
MRVADPEALARLLVVEPSLRASQDRIRALVARSGALLSGHFLLQSGLHTEYFIRFRQFAQDQEIRDAVAGWALETTGGKLPADLVLCPSSASSFLGEALARHAGVPLAVATADLWRRPTSVLLMGDIGAGSRVAVAVDVVTTGESLGPLFRLLEERGARLEVVYVFAAVQEIRFKQLLNAQRSDGRAVVAGTWPLYPQDRCPLCQGGVELLLGAEFS